MYPIIVGIIWFGTSMVLIRLIQRGLGWRFFLQLPLAWGALVLPLYGAAGLGLLSLAGVVVVEKIHRRYIDRRSGRR